MSNGVLGIDTQNILFREEGGVCEPIDRTLERILIDKRYNKNDISLEKRKNNNDYYKEHLYYFKNTDNNYYPGEKLCYPKERIVISHIRWVGLLISSRLRRIIQSE